VNARLALVNLQLEQQRLADAQTILEEGLGLLPGQPQLAMRLARIQVERGDLRGASDTLQKARGGASAANPEFHALHAAVLQRLTLHKDAVAEYQAALRLAPQAGVWWMGLGISLEADGRGAEAREAFQRARSSGALSAELDRFVEQKLRQLQ
jgi:MSHA biogenesis protein MshN